MLVRRCLISLFCNRHLLCALLSFFRKILMRKWRTGHTTLPDFRLFTTYFCFYSPRYPSVLLFLNTLNIKITMMYYLICFKKMFFVTICIHTQLRVWMGIYVVRYLRNFFHNSCQVLFIISSDRYFGKLFTSRTSKNVNSSILTINYMWQRQNNCYQALWKHNITSNIFSK